MARSIILLLDSFGIGYAHDAEKSLVTAVQIH